MKPHCSIPTITTCSLTWLESSELAWGHGLFLDSDDVIHWKWTLGANAWVNNLSESTLLLLPPSFHFIHSISLLPFVSLSHCISFILCLLAYTPPFPFSPPLRLSCSIFLSHPSDLHVEGLFRVPGHSLRQAALREMLNAGAEIDLETGDFHPNDAATLLKAYLGELPEPLLTHRHYHAHLKIGGAYCSYHKFLSHSDQSEVKTRKCKVTPFFFFL